MRILTPAIILLVFAASCSSPAQDQAIRDISSASMIVLSSEQSASSSPIEDRTKGLRIAAVGNGSAEILVAMGLTKSVVGRDIASEIVELQDVPVVTNGHDLVAERVLSLKPDILITDPDTSPKNVVRQVKRAGVQVVEMPESYDLDGISRKVSAIALAIGVPDIGDRLNASISSAIKEPAPPRGSKARVLFLYLRGSNGIFLVGGKGSGADLLLRAAGALDLGSTLYENPFTPINSEAILGLNPDRYLLMSAGLESVGGLDAFRRLPGIDPKVPVITVDDSLLLAFGPRTPDLIRQLREAIYD